MSTPPSGYGPPTWGHPAQPPQFQPPRRRRGWVLPVALGGGAFILMAALLTTCAVAIGNSAQKANDALASYTPAPAFSAPAGGPSATAAGGQSGGLFGSLEHPEDVELLNCTRSAGLGWAGVDVKVTNRSSKPSTYYIKIAYASPDGSVSYGEGWVNIDTLAPGQVTTRNAFPGQEVPAGKPLSCSLASARRTAA